MATRRASGLAAIIATTAWLSSLTPDGLALRPAPAAAFPPCMTPQGYLIICCPKPCPVLDPQKLPTELTKLQNEISKLTSVAKQLQQWQSMLKAIGSNPMALLSMLRGSSDVSAFKGLTIPTAGAALAGADFSTIGVFIKPGRMAFTRTFRAAYSTAVVRVRWLSADFEA